MFPWCQVHEDSPHPWDYSELTLCTVTLTLAVNVWEFPVFSNHFSPTFAFSYRTSYEKQSGERIQTRPDKQKRRQNSKISRYRMLSRDWDPLCWSHPAQSEGHHGQGDSSGKGDASWNVLVVNKETSPWTDDQYNGWKKRTQDSWQRIPFEVQLNISLDTSKLRQ